MGSKKEFSVHSRQLSNGVRIFVLPMAKMSYVAISVGVCGGSRHDPPDAHGMAHLVEHMVMTRTKKRPRTRILFRDLDALGGASNGGTNKDRTSFSVNVIPSDFATGADIMCDIVKDSLWSSEEFSAEHEVVLAELHGYEDDPEQCNLETLNERIFGDHELGHPLTGSVKAVTAIKNRGVRTFRDTHYVGSNIVVFIAGAITARTAFEIATPLFAQFEGGSPAAHDCFSLTQTEPRIEVCEKRLQQLQFALGFPTGPMTAKEIMTLDVLTSMLGDGAWSSLLFSKIRQPGLAYDVNAGSDIFEDAGAVYLWGGVSHANDKEVVRKILTILKRLKVRVSSEMLAFFKEYTCKQLVLNSESASWYAEDNLEEYVRKREVLTPTEQINLVQEVTARDVVSMARRVFDFSRVNLAVLGPCRSPNVYRRLIEEFL